MFLCYFAFNTAAGWVFFSMSVCLSHDRDIFLHSSVEYFKCLMSCIFFPIPFSISIFSLLFFSFKFSVCSNVYNYNWKALITFFLNDICRIPWTVKLVFVCLVTFDSKRSILWLNTKIKLCLSNVKVKLTSNIQKNNNHTIQLTIYSSYSQYSECYFCIIVFTTAADCSTLHSIVHQLNKQQKQILYALRFTEEKIDFNKVSV